MQLQLILLKKFGLGTVAFKSSSSTISKMHKDDPAFIKYQQNKLFTLLKKCIKINPLEADATAIRCLAIKVLFRSNFKYVSPLTKDETKPTTD